MTETRTLRPCRRERARDKFLLPSITGDLWQQSKSSLKDFVGADEDRFGHIHT
jgi:hypothetical protein